MISSILVGLLLSCIISINSVEGTPSVQPIKIPGKLMLAGEWSILEPGNHCIVMAVDKYLTATITNDHQKETELITLSFSLPDLNLPLITTTYCNNQLMVITPLNQEQIKLFSMCYAGAQIALQYLSQKSFINNCTITINSNLSNAKLNDKALTKLGLGSSAAAVVATIKALFSQAGYDITTPENQERIFKLSIIAHYQSQGNCGSGFDVAATTYGTTLAYERFDPAWLKEQLSNYAQALPYIDQSWPGLKITPITLPPELIVLVGFSGTSASTRDLLAAMKNYKEQALQPYMHIMTEINTLVTKLEDILVNSQEIPPSLSTVENLIDHNRSLLLQLAKNAKVDLETPSLTKLIQIAKSYGAVAKFSGAGGGDCGIALCSSPIIAEKIKQDWLHNGIIPVDVNILQSSQAHLVDIKTQNRYIQKEL